MGGLGSGRYDYATTATVGECHTITADTVADELEMLAGDPTDHVEEWPAEAPDDVDSYADVASRDDTDSVGFQYTWRDENGHGEEVGTITLYAEWNGHARFAATLDGVTRGDRADALEDRPTDLRLSYMLTPATGEGTEYEYRVPLEYTPCNFGGVRPWFLCPGRGCRDRVGKLHRPLSGDVFACRECHGLGYASSRASGQPTRRAIQRYKDAFQKADARDRRPHPNNMPHRPERPTGMHHDTFAELCADVEAARDEFHEAFNRKLRTLTGRIDDALPPE